MANSFSMVRSDHNKLGYYKARGMYDRIDFWAMSFIGDELVPCRTILQSYEDSLRNVLWDAIDNTLRWGFRQLPYRPRV